MPDLKQAFSGLPGPTKCSRLNLAAGLVIFRIRQGISFFVE